jgi:hypothetical protein
MSHPSSFPVLSWTVIEAGDRWYQAVLRFTAGAMPHDSESVRHLSIAAAGEVALGTDIPADRLHIVLWEVSDDPQLWGQLVDVIAGIRRGAPRSVQLAHFPSPTSRAAALAVQAAGVTVLLDELWMLQPLAQRLAGRVG